MLKVSGIDHINIEVKDLEESIQFYRRLFGFEIRKEQPDENSVIIGNDKVKLCIYETEGFVRYQKAGFHHFGLHIENFDDIISKCNEMGIKIFYGGPLKWQRSTSIYIQDPNGYEIELSEVFGGGI